MNNVSINCYQYMVVISCGVVLRETQGKDLKEEEIKWEPNCEEGPQRVNSFAGHERIYENERLRRGNEENKACWYTLEF